LPGGVPVRDISRGSGHLIDQLRLLRSERMGHAVPGMRGVYGHVSPAMRAALKAMLQERWEASLNERARLSARSIVPVLDAVLAAQRKPATKIGSHLAPKIGHRTRGTQ
jgi:hypothetical protein